jgi:hypothetical protein
MNKIYVIAGTAREATEWARSNLQKRILNGETPIGISEYVYVTGVDNLRGIRNPHGVFIGSWRHRLDSYEIVQALMMQTTHVNKALADIYKSVKPKIKPTPKLTGSQITQVYIDEAAKLMAQEIDNEVLKKLMMTNGGIL